MISIKQTGGWRPTTLDVTYVKPYSTADAPRIDLSMREDAEAARKEDRVEGHKLDVQLTEHDALMLAHYILTALGR